MSSSSVTASSTERVRFRSMIRAGVSPKLFLATCLTVLLSTFLYPLVLTGDPTWRVKLFEVLAATFFALSLLRSLTGGNQVEDPGLKLVAPEGSGAAGLLMVLAAGALAYAETFRFYFICDDFEHLALVRQTFMQSIWPQMVRGQSDGIVYIFYRPLGFASLFLDFRLWHYWAPGYHLTNVALHLICVAGVFFFCREIGLRKETCIAASLIFAFLPVNVQAVTWIGCRFDQLAAALGMWSLVFAARFRRTGRLGSYGMALVLFALAVLSKESAYIVALLWLALELIPQDRQPLQLPFTKHSEPLLGYVLVALLMWIHRWHTLGGVGGYRMASDGSPRVQSFQIQSLIGVLLRAPAEALYGYDWLQPASRGLNFVAVATAAIFLALCLVAKTSWISRRISWFCLIWIFAAAVPAHFYFCTSDPGLFFSRAVYFGAAGIAILIAVLLGQSFRKPEAILGAACVIAVLLLPGVQHNIAAWRGACQESLKVQTTLAQLDPAPARNTVFYLKGVPDSICGVPFFTVGLQNAVRFHYSWRGDIRVRTEKDRVIENSAIKIDLTPRR